MHAQLSGPPAGVPVPPVTSPPASAAPEATETAPDSRVFQIRLIDGRNGAPLDNSHVHLWYDDAGTPGYTLTTTPAGTALMPEPLGTPVRVLLTPDDRIDCRKHPQGEPAPGYNLEQIAERGVAAENSCGTVKVKPKPGELILFARPLRWYENINRP